MLQKYTKEWLEELCKDSFSCAEVLRKAGRKPSGGNHSYLKQKIEEYQIDTSHFTGKVWNKGLTKETDSRIWAQEKYTIDELLVENCQVVRHVVRRYILKYKVLGYKCAFCGNTGVWRNTQMALELDHINGINNDNRIENLRWLCPNCHAITPTHSGKNNRKEKEKIVKSTKKVAKQPENFCPDCQKPILASSKYCVDCSSKRSRVCERPAREELKTLIRSTPFTTIGKMFDVSDNAIRKWCVAYNLPSKSLEIKKITDEEWEQV